MGLSKKVVLQIKEVVKECMDQMHSGEKMDMPKDPEEPIIGPESNRISDYLGAASEEDKQYFTALSPDA